MHGIVSTGLVAGLALIEPRTLTTGRRLAYRGAVAAVAAWTMWSSLRPTKYTDADPLGPVGRAAITTGAAGAVLGFAEASEAIDARLHDGLVRVGARRPRLWLAAGEAAFSVLAWWASRLGDRIDSDDSEAIDGPVQALVDLPNELRAMVLFILAATDEHGAPQLREQLSAARVISFDAEAIEISFAQFDTLDDLPRAVPGNARFPVIGRFSALDERAFDVRVFVEDGRLESVHIDEGADWTPEERDAWYEAGHDFSELTAWPRLEDIELFTETEAGYRQIPA